MQDNNENSPKKPFQFPTDRPITLEDLQRASEENPLPPEKNPLNMLFNDGTPIDTYFVPSEAQLAGRRGVNPNVSRGTPYQIGETRKNRSRYGFRDMAIDDCITIDGDVYEFRRAMRAAAALTYREGLRFKGEHFGDHGKIWRVA